MEVFVYGTLTDPAHVRTVLDDWRFDGVAVLDGLHRVDGSYPTLAPGGSVQGRLLRTGEVDRLDEYEGVESGLYDRVSVPRRRDGRSVAVYVGHPDRLDADVAWPGEGTFSRRLRDYLRGNDVFVRVLEDRQG